MNRQGLLQRASFELDEHLSMQSSSKSDSQGQVANLLVLTEQIPLSQADETWFTGVCHSNRFNVSVSRLFNHRIGNRDFCDDVCNKHDDQRFLACRD